MKGAGSGGGGVMMLFIKNSTDMFERNTIGFMII